MKTLLELGVKYKKIIPFKQFLYRQYLKNRIPKSGVAEIQGFKMAVDRNENRLSLLATFGYYSTVNEHEKTTTDVFKKVVQQGDVVLDLGANLGYFSLLARTLVGPEGKVFAFDPEPKNYEYLKKNIALNKFSDNVEAHQLALSNKAGFVDLFICPYDSGHHTINQKEGITAYKETRGKIEKVVVPAVTIDSMGFPKVDVIKMDVEGSEVMALEGMELLLKRSRDIKLFIEYFPMLIEKMGDKPEDLFKRLFDQGFHVWVIPDDYQANKDTILWEVRNMEELKRRMSGEESAHVNLYCQRWETLLFNK